MTSRWGTLRFKGWQMRSRGKVRGEGQVLRNTPVGEVPTRTVTVVGVPVLEVGRSEVWVERFGFAVKSFFSTVRTTSVLTVFVTLHVFTPKDTTRNGNSAPCLLVSE